MAAAAAVATAARAPALAAALRSMPFGDGLLLVATPTAAALLVGGIVLLWLVRRGGRASANAARGRPENAAAAIEGMTAREFATLLGEAFQRQGYQLVQGDAGGGVGVDMTLRKHRETVLVHTQQWRAERVGAETLGSLRKTMSARSATGGIVVTSGRFSREAIAFARQANLTLIDGPVLLGMLVKARSAHPVGAAAGTADAR